MKKVLTIAGSDSGGGAGIQADLKTMTMNGVFAMSAVTALTAQNTTGVQGIYEVTPEFLKQQIDSVFTDLRPDAVKIGMVSSSPLIEAIAERLAYYGAEKIVVDPVMVATSGARLIAEDAVDTLSRRLFPLAAVLTPNVPEAEVLSGHTIRNETEMETAAEEIGRKAKWFRGKRIRNDNTHGTGCTLSSAIAANLAKGFSLEESVGRAKEYISGALSAMLDIGAGSGPMAHNFALTGRFAEEAEA